MLQKVPKNKLFSNGKVGSRLKFWWINHSQDSSKTFIAIVSALDWCHCQCKKAD